MSEINWDDPAAVEAALAGGEGIVADLDEQIGRGLGRVSTADIAALREIDVTEVEQARADVEEELSQRPEMDITQILGDNS